MLTSLGRIRVLTRHLYATVTLRNVATFPGASLSVSPSACLVDEKIRISVSGLEAGQLVTLTSLVEENGSKFEARGVFKANKAGKVDNIYDPSIAGTFTQVEPMGLFWSLEQTPGQTPYLMLTKGDVSTPLIFNISVYNGAHVDGYQISQTPLASTAVHRFYKRPSVRRVPVTKGPYKGTIFIPDGDGPFPALTDMSGVFTSLTETRAALLASHGYATFALCYLYQDGLPKTLLGANLKYIKEATEWFIQQDYVDETRCGAVGLSHGGCLTLQCATVVPQIKVIVNINGVPLSVAPLNDAFVTGKIPNRDKTGKLWPYGDLVYKTDRGVDLTDILGNVDDLLLVPAWQHGAKILTIVGEDDKQVEPTLYKYVIDNMPDKYRSNMEMHSYPGAGHLIEPPYSPLYHTSKPGRSRMATMEFIPDHFRDGVMALGGNPEHHAKAQEDSWQRILTFLETHLKCGE